MEVAYVGPREARRVTADELAGAALYAQPGGGDLTPAYRRLRRQSPIIRDFVRGGGRYLGFCLGGYLAGRTPGFDLLPGDADQYISSPDATISSESETLTTVRWRGEEREVYFQDGPFFDLDPADRRGDVLAVYDNGLPAALVAPCGTGVVGVVGPHPEADADWFRDSGLREVDASDLGNDLVDAVMRA